MITFDDSKIIKALNGPVYIYVNIYKIPTHGCLVDPTSLVNVITEEHLFMKGLQYDFYDTSDVWIQNCNGFIYLSFSSIDLLVKLCGNIVKTTFVFVSNSDQFQVKLGLPWLNAMHAISSPIHKYLKFFLYD